MVLDELNLAPTDVLEALNRLLDDNQELFIPETQQVVRPHPHFRLFATQNPPGAYGGRKALSRALRNRFVELHMDEIPDVELKEILERRCACPPRVCGQMVEVMKELQRHRQGSRLFAGKYGFITSRDLFRWAGRLALESSYGKDVVAQDGYCLLAERLRKDEEKAVVAQVLEKVLKCKLNVESWYVH